MTDPLSMNPQDEELLSEITLLADLMIAANEADGRVPPDTVDLILTDAPPLAREPISMQVVPHQRTGHTDDRDARRERARRVEREIAIHRRAIEVQRTAVARFTEMGDFERANLARRRFEHARKLLYQALKEQGELLLGYAALGSGSGPDVIGHAVAEGSSVSVCGMEVSSMVVVTEAFSTLPAGRRCAECAGAVAGVR